MDTAEPQSNDDESVDIDVSDLNATAHIEPVCPHCSGDVTNLIRRVENTTWKTARKTFKAKQAAKAKAEPKTDPTADRIGALEQLVTTAFPLLLGIPPKKDPL